jgi:hypothetical protein
MLVGASAGSRAEGRGSDASLSSGLFPCSLWWLAKPSPLSFPLEFMLLVFLVSSIAPLCKARFPSPGKAAVFYAMVCFCSVRLPRCVKPGSLPLGRGPCFMQWCAFVRPDYARGFTRSFAGL